jgi:hypothetical protein
MGLNELYLISYYNKGLIYNSPIFHDMHSIVSNLRSKLLSDHGPFDKIFLYYALEPNALEPRQKVFQLWP